MATGVSPGSTTTGEAFQIPGTQMSPTSSRTNDPATANTPSASNRREAAKATPQPQPMKPHRKGPPRPPHATVTPSGRGSHLNKGNPTRQVLTGRGAQQSPKPLATSHPNMESTPTSNANPALNTVHMETDQENETQDSPERADTTFNTHGQGNPSESWESVPPHNTDTSAMDEDGFTPVEPKQRHIPKLTPTENLCRVLLSCMGSYQELERYPIPFLSIFEALMMIDPQAAIVPSSRDPARAIGLSLLLRTAQDYKTMMDITLVHWGKPSDKRGRLALSFYASSTVLTPDLALL